MRVLHCITGLSADGAQRMLFRLTERLQSRGISNCVLSMASPEPFEEAFREKGIPVYCLGLGGCPSTWFKGIKKYRNLVREFSPDLLQGWMYHANVLLSTVRQSCAPSVPMVWNIRRGMDDYRERKLSTRWIIRANSTLSGRADSIIFCTDRSREQHREFGFNDTNGVIIGNGFDIEKFAPRPTLRRTVRSALGIGESDLVIGNVGRDDVAKGRPYLFEAFRRVLREFPCARLLLVGRGLVRENESLHEELVSFGIRDRVHLVGEKKEMEGVYPAIDVMCSSSISEGFPNVIAEAMASGIPCVVTDTGSSRDLVEGVGEVSPPRSGEKLARGLIKVCQEGDSGWQERGLRGRERIRVQYSLDRVVSRYADLYRDLVNERRRLSEVLREIPLGADSIRVS